MQKDHPELASATEAQQQAAATITGKFMGRLMDLYNLEEMLSDMGGLYQKYLSRSDVEGMIAFYGSPAGQHLLDIQPVILQEYLPLVMQRMQDRLKNLSDQMIKEIKELP